jgi:glycosidase
VKSLLKLRREHAALRTGKLFHVFSDDQLYLFVRQNDEERLLVVFNNSAKTQALNIAQPKTPLEDALRSTLLYGRATSETNGLELKISAPPQSVSIFSLN